MSSILPPLPPIDFDFEVVVAFNLRHFNHSYLQAMIITTRPSL